MRTLFILSVLLSLSACGDDTSGTHAPRSAPASKWQIRADWLGSYQLYVSWSGPYVQYGAVILYDENGNEVGSEDISAGATSITVDVNATVAGAEVSVVGSNGSQKIYSKKN